MPPGKCIRCFFSGERKAVDQVKVTYGSNEYVLALCQQHASEFDDALWGWLRTAEIVDHQKAGITHVWGDSTRTRLSRETPQAAPEPRPVPVPDEPVQPAKTQLEVLQLRWIMSEHAQERLAQRGPVFGFNLEEVLRCADQPERVKHTVDKRDGRTNVWMHYRGRVMVVVNREEKVILTVGAYRTDDVRTDGSLDRVG